MEGFQSELLSLKVNYICIKIIFISYFIITYACFHVLLFFLSEGLSKWLQCRKRMKRKLNCNSPAPNLIADLNPAKKQHQLQPPDGDVKENAPLQVEQKSRTNSDLYFVQNLLIKRTCITCREKIFFCTRNSSIIIFRILCEILVILYLSIICSQSAN